MEIFPWKIDGVTTTEAFSTAHCFHIPSPFFSSQNFSTFFNLQQCFHPHKDFSSILATFLITRN